MTTPMRMIRGVPQLGLGTWLRTGDEGERSIRDAIEIGYRHFDTAQTYDTEAQVGRAVRASGLRRDAVFVTTKVGDVNLARKDFPESLRRSLDTIGLGPVDLTLIHWPIADGSVPLASYIEDLVEAKALGLTRAIGVSNFTCELAAAAVRIAGPGELVTNQVEVHPYLQNRTLEACCASLGIALTAYMPLAGGRVVSDPVLVGISKRLGVPPAAIALAWLMDRGMIAIPASGKRDHMASNHVALELQLSADDSTAIDALDRGERLINPSKSPRWD